MITDCQKLVAHLSSRIYDLTDVAVLGLSGGADSTLVALLCKEALGKENVFSIGMPYNDTDVETFNSRSANLASRIGIRHEQIGIAGVTDSLSGICEEITGNHLTDLNAGNSRSRIRMCILYGVAHSLATSTPEGMKVRVVGTGNLSEDYIGYDTKGGDALADFFPIGELFKSEVYQLLDWFIERGTILEEDVDRTPSAGLEDSQTDEGDLSGEFGAPITYNQMEASIRKFRAHGGQAVSANDMGDVDTFVFRKYLANRHKHQAPHVIGCRFYCD